jgi:hypothetical protein
MTVEVAGHWELGWSAPITELELWRMAARSFGLSSFNMTPVSGIASRFVHEHASTESMVAAFPDLTPVYVDEGGEVELSDFVHPPSALYVFGKATYSPFSARAKQGVSVRIACDKKGLLWPHQAMALVLYDRSCKQ